MNKQTTTQEQAVFKLPSPRELCEAGAHLGHRTSRWHPKMEPYIFCSKHGVHLFDLEKTIEQLSGTLSFLNGIISRGGLVLFVGTKPAAKALVKETAQALNMPYVTERWLGGTLTNFRTINKRLKHLEDLEAQQAGGAWEKFTKKERLQLQRKMAKLQEQLEGIRGLSRLPDAVFVADAKKDILPLREAKIVKAAVVAICDSNIDPTSADYPICANDDAVTSLKIILDAFKDNLKGVKPISPTTKDAAGEKTGE
ncbi:MAG: 30S ribosomal protein S2 [Candidatus Portnoybacteria bacterium]|jgi:small subunit ribosomal protein S2|nr:30S ribosomal protein S2 [Candidatus Portnoybacteria bacterium]